MSKKRVVAENESVIITNGKRRFIKRGQVDKEVKMNASEVDQEKEVVKERRKQIKDVLDHELYTKELKDVERTDALLGEFLELGFISNKTFEEFTGKELKLESVKDVEKLIEENEE